MATWSITSEGPGYLIRKDREKPSVMDEDLDDALRYIRSRFKPGDKVVQVDKDGYRIVITRQVARKGWRR